MAKPNGKDSSAQDSGMSFGLKIGRRFTEKGKDPYSYFEYDKRVSKIANPDGSVVFEMKNVEVPKTWSQVATDILAQKYFRKKGVPQIGENGEVLKDEMGLPVLGAETSVKQVNHRLAATWRHWGEKYGYFGSAEDADAFEDELKYMLTAQICAPNSPQWFNTGLFHAYGITGDAQGHYYVNPDTGVLSKSEDAYSRPQPHACFIQSVKDDLVAEGGIFDLVTREARLFKYGSGTGTNFSGLRGANEGLSGGGKSSGLMSFLAVLDRAAGAIKSGGTTRRAAKMVCLDMDHPEVEDFIDWKMIEEQKVAALTAGSYICYEELKRVLESAIEGGIDPEKNPELKKRIYQAHKKHVPLNYIKRMLMLTENGMKLEDFDFRRYDTDFRSEAYLTVGGQNSNNSVRVPNTFINAVKEDGEWELINRTNGKAYKKMQARQLWDKIAKAAWSSADPGLQFDTTINEWHTCPTDGRINASNPCSEYMFLDDTACNLASINLITLFDEKTGKFDVAAYKHAIRIWTIVLEISVLMAQFPSKEIAQLSYEFRTLGLGYANLGTLLMQMGIPYTSEEGYAICGAMSAILTGHAYATSAEIASVIGAFPKFEKNREPMMKVMRNHRRAAYNGNKAEYEGLTVKPQGINAAYCPTYMIEAAKECWDEAVSLGEKYGYRNAQVTVIAPTGTIGLLMDCDTTGIEPDFALVKFKKLVGGGYFKIVNQSVQPALRKLGYNAEQINDIVGYLKGNATLNGCPFINPESLQNKGFTAKELMAVEAQLTGAFDLKFTFNKYSLGEDFCKTVLGFTDEQLNNPKFSMLDALGYTAEQIEAANEYVCGTMMIEGAPHLRTEHYPIFDCANKCGKHGKRYIPYTGHIHMMAAAQPFISGSISKTVNMPEEATVEDVKDAYMQSWELMLKCNALYRDGSKLSQPLNTGSSDSTYAGLFNFSDIQDADEGSDARDFHKVVTKMAERPLRKKLPEERRSITHKFSISGHEGYVTVGLYDDNSPGELFIKMNKEGSTLSGIMDALATSISMNLQYGVPMEVLASKFCHTRFEPAGMTGNRDIPMVKSIVDYLGRWMALKFLPREVAKKYHNADLVDRAYEEGTSLFLQKVPLENMQEMTDDSRVESGLKAMKNMQMTRAGAGSANVGAAVGSHSVSMSGMGQMQGSSAGGAAMAGDQGAGAGADGGSSPFGRVQASLALKTGNASAPMCSTCGMTMVSNGACYKCVDCGDTSGCS